MPLGGKGNVQGRFIETSLKKEAYIFVYAEGHDYSDGVEPPEIFWKVCDKTYNDCFLDDFERDGKASTVKSIGVKMVDGVRTGYIYHQPSVCFNPDDCTYLFAVKNSDSEYRLCSIRVSIETYNPQDVNIQLPYKNVVQYGQFINYEINPISNKNI